MPHVDVIRYDTQPIVLIGFLDEFVDHWSSYSGTLTIMDQEKVIFLPFFGSDGSLLRAIRRAYPSWERHGDPAVRGRKVRLLGYLVQTAHYQSARPRAERMVGKPWLEVFVMDIQFDPSQPFPIEATFTPRSSRSTRMRRGNLEALWQHIELRHHAFLRPVPPVAA